MAGNVTEVLAGKAQTLLEKLVTNPDLCNFILGLLGRCIVVCANLGRPIEGIEIGHLDVQEIENGDLTLRAPVTFHDMQVTPASIWPPQNDFAQYTRSKANGLGMALQKNPKLSVFFQEMVTRIDSYCSHRGLQFGALHVKQAVLTSNNRIVLKVGKNVLDH